MAKGLLVLPMPFEYRVKICGAWGVALAITIRAAHGMGSSGKATLLMAELIDS